MLCQAELHRPACRISTDAESLPGYRLRSSKRTPVGPSRRQRRSVVLAQVVQVPTNVAGTQSYTGDLHR